MSITVRPVAETEFGAFCTQLARGFGQDLEGPAETRRVRRLVDPGCTSAAFEGTTLVGTCAAFPVRLTVPGGTVPMAGTTMVTVRATHRRQGIMRAMLAHHLAEARAREEILAGLWASEGTIYPRFGYGLATDRCQLDLAGPAVAFRDDLPTGRSRLLEPKEAEALLPEIYASALGTRAGMLSRNPHWWKHRLLRDAPEDRKGGSAHRYAIHEAEDGSTGYAIYRQHGVPDSSVRGSVDVLELVATTGETHAGLWRHLTGIDLFPEVRYWNAPADDELKWRVTDPYRVCRTLRDGLWIALLDVPRALGARRYESAGKLVLGVHSAGTRGAMATFGLETGPDGARCTRVRASPDLELTLDTLGALYLGGRPVTALARAGRVQGDARAVELADRLLRTRQAPWCPEIF